MSTPTPTGADLESALKVVTQGKAVHGLYAFEDAMDVVKSLARFYWRQSSFGLLSTGVSFLVLIEAGVPLPWLILGVLVLSVAITFVAHKAQTLSWLFAPKGFSANDVAAAYFQTTRPT